MTSANDPNQSRDGDASVAEGGGSKSPTLRLTWLIGVSLLVLTATFVAELASPALHGWRTGMGNWILLSERLAAVSTQFAAMTGCFAGMTLLGRVLRVGQLPVTFRIGLAPVSAAVLTSVIASAARPLPPHLTLGLSILSALLMLATASVMLFKDSTRGVAICVGLVGTAALLNTIARFIAIRASHLALASLFDAGRGLATVATLLVLAGLILGMVWISARRWQHLLALGIVCGFLALLAGLVSWQGTGSEPTGWISFFERALAGAGRHPLPFLPRSVRASLDVTTWTLAVSCLTLSNRPLLMRLALSLALLSRAATDIPLLALALTLSALTLPLAWSDPEPTAMGDAGKSEPRKAPAT